MSTALLKIIFTLNFIMLLMPVLSQSKAQHMKTLHDFNMVTIDGKEQPLAEFKGNKVMVVNTASECGLTPQYEILQELYEAFKDANFVIIGFPANNFGGQEPGTNVEIATFCNTNYGITFPMFSKISVNGEDQHPLYQWLTKKELNGVADAAVSWNFQKFLIDENGHWVKSIPPQESPATDEVINWLNSN